MSTKGFASQCVKDSDYKPENKPTQIPVHATSSFTFESMSEGMDIFENKREGYVYSRYGNPQVQSVAEKIARLELGDHYQEDCAVLTSSGMAAIHSLLMTLLSPGDAILTQPDLYGGTTDLIKEMLEPLGIECITMSLDQTDEVKRAIAEHPNIKMIYFETPANPLLSIVSIEQVVAVAQTHELMTVCDNTFATPYLQSPFQYGIDFVIHSTTKYLNGHGNAIGGVVLGREPKDIAEVRHKKILLGCQANPFDSWLLNQGIKTLALRMEKHCRNAQKIAEFLAGHSLVHKVHYPGLTSHPGHEIAGEQMNGFGGMLSFEIKGDLEDAIRFSDALEFIERAPTLGDVESLVLHPASMSHRNMPGEEREKLGINDSLIRLSVGIEDAHDIERDLYNAFEAIS